MITRFRVRNYKALRDVTLDLTPIMSSSVPTTSGKTSILEAVAALCRSVDRQLSKAFTGLWKGRELVWKAARDLPVILEAEVEAERSRLAYQLTCRFFRLSGESSKPTGIFGGRTCFIRLGVGGPDAIWWGLDWCQWAMPPS
jgi:predicted ATPase